VGDHMKQVITHLDGASAAYGKSEQEIANAAQEGI
jgi:hypothetical protein